MRCDRAFKTNEILIGFIRENPKLFAWYLLFLVFVPLTDIGVPHMVGKLIKNLQKRDNLYRNFLIIIVLISLSQIGHLISDSIDVQMLPRMVEFIRRLIVTHILDIQSSNYQEIKSGEINTKLIKLPVAYSGFIEQWKNNWMPELIVVLVAVIYLLYVNPIVGFISLFVTITVLYYCYNTIFKCESISRHRDAAFNDTVEETDDILKNSVSVINSNQQDKELERLKEKHSIYEKHSYDSFTCALKPRFMYLPIIVGVFMVYMIYSYYQIRAKDLEIASFVVVLLIVIQVITSLFKILGSVKDAVFKWGVLQYSMELFKKCEPETVVGGSTNQKKDIPSEGIYLDSLSYKYKTPDGDRPVFESLRMHIEPYKCTMIEGKIGAGKSTLLKLLNKYYSPDKGEIYINGMAYSALTNDDIHHIVGYVPQSPILFNRSVYENIVYGIEPQPSKEDVETMLRKMNVHELVDNLPKGLDTAVGKNGANISGGQRQIVWFLRVLLQDPAYIILDEPTSAMDSKTKTYVYNIIQEIPKDKTIIVVSHDTKLRQYADKIIQL